MKFLARKRVLVSHLEQKGKEKKKRKEKSAFAAIVNEGWDAGLNAYDKTRRVRIGRAQTGRQLSLRLVCAC